MSLLLTPLDGRVTLKGLLGIGGMGEVHRAWDAGLERPVAAKFVRSGDPKEADRLLLEARLQARVEHPNVVRVHDTGTLEGRPCILLQLVEGKTFADLGTEADWRMKVSLAAQAARGLGAAHRMGLIHRDVKPANILVEESQEGLRALLSDFGLARDEEGGLTRSGLLMGTVDFMAPEQVTGEAPVDFRADIYGLGATLYAMLAGRPPFRKTPGPTAHAHNTQDLHGATPEGDLHPGDLLRRVLEQQPRSLAAEVPGLPKDLAVVVAKAMEKEPAQRYITSEALADDLERVLRGEAILARPTGWVEQGTRWMRRNPVAARAVGLGLVAVLAAGAFASWNSRRSTMAALDAAQLGGEAKAFELRLRMAHLAPAHDLRPVHAELRAGLARLAGRRGAGSSASDYARGRVLLLLNQLDEARSALELAAKKGFKGPELEAALGLVYGRLYNRDLPRAEALQDDALRSQRIAELDRSLKAPALAHLRAPNGALLQQAYAALLEQRFEEARDIARRAREQDPELAEASLLGVQTWIREGEVASRVRDLARGEVCAREGLKAIQGLIEALRSDPEVPLAVAILKGLQADVIHRRGGDGGDLIKEGLVMVDKALALDPGLVEGWKGRAQLLKSLSDRDANEARTDGESILRQGVESARRAVALAPERGDLHLDLAHALYSLGHHKLELGQDPLSELKAGQQAGETAHRLEPWDPNGLHLAMINTLHQARHQLSKGDPAKEALSACKSIASSLQNLRGLHPRLLKGTLADLYSLQAQAAWIGGGDPDSLQAASLAEYEALRTMEPDRLTHITNVGYAACTRAELRVAAGRDLEDMISRVLPQLDEGLKRWPRQPLLLYYRAYLLALSLYGSPAGRPMALDPARRRLALQSTSEAFKFFKHPGLLEVSGWMYLAMAEAGIQRAAAHAVRDFERGLAANLEGSSLKLGLFRALRARGGLGDSNRARGLVDGMGRAGEESPEVLLCRAALLMDQGRVAEAEAMRGRTVSLQPLLAGHPLLVWGTTSKQARK